LPPVPARSAASSATGPSLVAPWDEASASRSPPQSSRASAIHVRPPHSMKVVAREDPSQEVFRFDFSVFDFLQHEALWSQEDDYDEGVDSLHEDELEHDDFYKLRGGLAGGSSGPPLTLGAMPAAPLQLGSLTAAPLQLGSMKAAPLLIASAVGSSPEKRTAPAVEPSWKEPSWDQRTGSTAATARPSRAMAVDESDFGDQQDSFGDETQWNPVDIMGRPLPTDAHGTIGAASGPEMSDADASLDGEDWAAPRRVSRKGLGGSGGAGRGDGQHSAEYSSPDAWWA